MRPHDTQHRFSVNNWAGLVSDLLIGLYLLPSPITSVKYLIFLEHFLPGLLQDVLQNVRRKMWFQDDGTHPHYVLCARQRLITAFGKRWIGHGRPVACHPAPYGFMQPGFLALGGTKICCV